MPNLLFYGHAMFALRSENSATLVFDPFVKDNPFVDVAPEEVPADYILVSHGHFDHLGDAYTIAAAQGATIISTAEIAHQAREKGLEAHAQHLGGKHAFPFGSVKLTLAFHGSGVPGGHACGFLVNYEGKKVYFAGDTALFGDMKLIGDREKPDVALLPIGDNFTMGIDDAVAAVELLRPGLVIPYHYNTWPLIAADPAVFKTRVEEETGSRCIILAPGEQHVY